MSAPPATSPVGTGGAAGGALAGAPVVVVTGRHRWAVRQVGAAGGSAPALLVVGDGDDRPGAWRAVTPAWASDRRVLLLSLPGTRDAGGPVPASLAGAAQAAEALLDALGLAVVDVVAHGDAGPVVLAIAARAPGRVARLVLLAAPHPSGLRRHRRWARGPQVGRDRLLARLRTRGAARRWSALASRPLPRAAPDAGGPAGRHLGGPGGDGASGGRVPVEAALVVWGVRDRVLPLRVGEDAVRALGAGASLVTLPGVGHSPHLDAAAEVADAVGAFLRAGRGSGDGAAAVLPPAVGRTP